MLSEFMETFKETLQIDTLEYDVHSSLVDNPGETDRTILKTDKSDEDPHPNPSKDLHKKLMLLSEEIQVLVEGQKSE